MSNFTYKPRSADAWKSRAEQSGSKFAGYALDEFKTYSAKKGSNWIRILPPTWENPAHYGLDLWVHFSVGPENGTVICLRKMKNQACPICEEFDKAEAQGKENAKDFKPIRRVLVWLINREDEKEKRPLLWAMGWTVDRDITKICRDRQTGELFQIDHPDSGYDISFDVEGEKPMIKYVGWQIARRSSPVDQAYLDYILKNPLDTVLAWRTYEEVKALLEGGVLESPSAAPAPYKFETETKAAPVAAALVVASAPAPVAAPVAAPALAPQAPFVSEWTTEHCSICGKPQYTIPTGVTCEAGHINAQSVEELAEIKAAQAAQAPLAAAAPAPPPSAPPAQTAPAGLFDARPTGAVPAAAAPAAETEAQPISRAASLRSRFATKNQ